MLSVALLTWPYKAPSHMRVRIEIPAVGPHNSVYRSEACIPSRLPSSNGPWSIVEQECGVTAMDTVAMFHKFRQGACAYVDPAMVE